MSANQHAQLALNDAVVLMGVIDHALADFDIFVKRLVAAVNHDAGEAFINAFLAKIERIAVVEVDGNRDVGGAYRGLDELFEINSAGILAGAF